MRPRNIEYFEFDLTNKKGFFIIDHPTALIAWRKAFKEGIISRDATLFHLDRHTDFYFNSDNTTKSKQILTMSDLELEDFVMKDLFILNDEFIVNAMFSGLIKDGISIHFEEGNDYGDLIEDIESSPRKRKFMYDEKEHNYYLYNEREITSINSMSNFPEIKKLFTNRNNFILDIDLDFFTDFNAKTVSKTPDEISRQMMSTAVKNSPFSAV